MVPGLEACIHVQLKKVVFTGKILTPTTPFAGP
jgi:hypothetical protein